MWVREEVVRVEVVRVEREGSRDGMRVEKECEWRKSVSRE